MSRVIEVGRDEDLPPDLIASRAEIRFPYPGVPTVAGAHLSDCRISAKKLTRVDWRLTTLERCSFHGHFIDNDFGPETIERVDGSVATGVFHACDFTDARLDGCRFFDVDLAQCRFPSWPGFLVLNPRKHAKQLASKPWEGPLGIWVAVLGSQAPNVNAFAFDAVDLSKHAKVKMNVVRQRLDRFKEIIVIT